MTTDPGAERREAMARVASGLYLAYGQHYEPCGDQLWDQLRGQLWDQLWVRPALDVRCGWGVRWQQLISPR
jgi:hypothetical protein